MKTRLFIPILKIFCDSLCVYKFLALIFLSFALYPSVQSYSGGNTRGFILIISNFWPGSNAIRRYISVSTWPRGPNFLYFIPTIVPALIPRLCCFHAVTSGRFWMPHFQFLIWDSIIMPSLFPRHATSTCSKDQDTQNQQIGPISWCYIGREEIKEALVSCMWLEVINYTSPIFSIKYNWWTSSIRNIDLKYI